MGFWDDLTGQSAADASKAAAADTYAKQQAATQGITQAGGQYASGMAGLAQGYQPWQQTGQTANSALQRLLADPSSLSSLPGYQFQMDQGTRALDHSASAGGSLFSGRAGKALQSYGQGLADQTYGSQLQRLLGISQQGLGATQAGLGMQGQGLTGQLGANTSAYNGQLTSAGTIGQGDVAAANAKAAGSQNLLNTGISVAGMALGIPPVGMMGGGKSSPMNTLFGSSPQYGGGNFMNSSYGGSSSNPLEGLSAADYGIGF